MLTCTKIYSEIPFAHRAHRHDGHCALVHGHNWNFEITFAARDVDENGFVIDFGKLHRLKDIFDQHFDHKFVMNKSDPLIEDFKEFLSLHGLENITVIPDCSAEGIARYVYQLAT